MYSEVGVIISGRQISQLNSSMVCTPRKFTWLKNYLGPNFCVLDIFFSAFLVFYSGNKEYALEIVRFLENIS